MPVHGEVLQSGGDAETVGEVGGLRILIACERSGTVRDAFTLAGHDATSCDLVQSAKPGKHYTGSVLDILGDGWDIMIAHPPCTYLTVTGNRWMRHEFAERYPTRLQDRADAAVFFMELVTAPIPRICIENPIGVMSSRYKRPTQVIQPYHFGHVEPKATCLWLKNLPRLTPTDIREPAYLPPCPNGKRMAAWYHTRNGHIDRSTARAVTFQGIANAMATQWTEDAIGAFTRKRQSVLDVLRFLEG